MPVVLKCFVEAADIAVPAFPGDPFDRLAGLPQPAGGPEHALLQHEGVEGTTDGFAEMCLQFCFADVKFSAEKGHRDGTVEVAINVIAYLQKQAGLLLIHVGRFNGDGPYMAGRQRLSTKVR